LEGRLILPAARLDFPLTSFLRLSDRRTDLENKVRIVERELDAELAQITVETDENDPESVRISEQQSVDLQASASIEKSDALSSLEMLEGEERLFRMQESHSWDHTAQILCKERLWLKKVNFVCGFCPAVSPM
jgi:hypothetical protein